MKKWLVVKEFILGEAFTNIRGLYKDRNDFILGQGTIILQSEVTDKIIINDKEYHFNIGKAFEKFCSLQEIIPESITASIGVGLPTVGEFTWVKPTDLQEVVPGTVYRTPDAFVPDSLSVAVRGLLVLKENEDGFDIIDNQTFMLKEPLSAGNPKDWVLVGYQKA